MHALNVAEWISQIGDEGEREKKYRRFLEFYDNVISFLVWNFVHIITERAMAESEKSGGGLPDEYAYARIKEFVFDWLSPLVNVLHMIDYNLWSNHRVLSKIAEEKNRQMDKALDEFYLLTKELEKNGSQ